MTKFTAQSLTAFWSDEANAGRRARVIAYAALNTPFTHVVTAEADDGSWCEFDAEDFGHAKRLADNAVDRLGARGCSVWLINPKTGEYLRGPSLYHVYDDGITFDNEELGC
jgi:hypothetical protein